jgi:hypothetical protein
MLARLWCRTLTSCWNLPLPPEARDGNCHPARWSALRLPRAQGTCHGFRKNRHPV